MSRSTLIKAGAVVTAPAMLLASCVTAPLPERGTQVDISGQLAFAIPVVSLIGRRFETVVRQQYDFSCGSAALATLLRFHYRDPQTEQSVFVGMFNTGDQAQIRRLGFSLLDMKRYLARRGLSADGYRVTIAQIAKARVPGIALIDFNGYKHFVVVKGVTGSDILLGDPSLGLRRERLSTFRLQWNGVLFVLNGRMGEAAGGFGSEKEYGLAPGARFYPQAEPLGLSGLELTRPMVLPAPLPRDL